MVNYFTLAEGENMKTRYFYHTDEEKIYTLSELEKLYNELVASGDINTEEEPFYYYIDACTDKNGALTEIYGNLYRCRRKRNKHGF